MSLLVCSLAGWVLFNILFAGCFVYPVAVSELMAARSRGRGKGRGMRRTV